MLARAYSVKIGIIFGVRIERWKVDKKQTYMKTETCKLYSREFRMFLPNIIKIDHYNSELYHFKVGAFFWDTVYIHQRHQISQQNRNPLPKPTFKQ